MSSVEELLNQPEIEPFAETGTAHDEEIYCIINPETRTIEVPEEYKLLGVTGDKKVERIWFQCPKVVGYHIDLSDDFVLFINYENAEGIKDAYNITDMQVKGENIVFSWELSEDVTAYEGNIKFSFRAIKPERDRDNEWNTTINTDCNVLIGLQTNEYIEADNPNIIAQMLDSYNKMVDRVNELEGKIVSTLENFNSLANNSQITQLQTKSKTLVGAANELNNMFTAQAEYSGDCNDLTQSGLCKNIITPSNGHSPGFYAYVLVLKGINYEGTQSHFTQVAFPYNSSNQIVTRHGSGSTWSEWA